MDWNKLKREYVKGGISYKQLSEKYGVSLSALKRLGAKEGWGELRSQTVAKTSQKLVDSLSSKNAEVGTRMFAVVNRLLDKVEKAVEELDITMVTNTRKEKTIEYNNTLRPDKPTKEIVEETEQLMETRTIVDRSGLKAIASALRDIKEIQMLRSDLDVQEQEARIARLQKDAQKEDDTVSEVVVTIGGGDAAWQS